MSSAFAIAQACTGCPHPGVFTGSLGLYTNPSTAYCGLTDTLANSIYASIPVAFFDPP
ncbi:hypothetical protein MMC28_008177, partial [Mycoblastus sanguinarius]|nr:hypothetical protein [Mycoblastus sanguinarius]